jgi:hypothetical protein
MEYNHDPRDHKAYTRVKGISIDYGADRIPVVRFTIQQAVIDGSGRVRHTDATPIGKGPISAINLPATVPAVDEATGQLIDGKTVSMADLQQGLASYTRWVLDQENKPTDQPTDGTDSAPVAQE